MSNAMICKLAFLTFFLPLFGHAQESRLRVGVVLPTSGAMASYGEELLNGAKLALQDLEKEENAAAKNVQILVEDDQSIARRSEAAARKLVSSKRVDMLFGGLTSSTTLAIAKVAVDEKIPLVAPAATHPDITGQGSYVFRTCVMDNYQGVAMSKFATDNLKAKKAAVLLDPSSTYASGIVSAFEAAFEGKIISKQTYNLADQDFSTQLKNIKRSGAQVVILPGYYPEVARILTQAQALGVGAKFLGSDGWDSPRLYSLTRKTALKGHYYLSHFSSLDGDDSVQAFVSSYEKTYRRKPGMLAAMGYDGMKVAVAAFATAKNSLPSALVRAFGQIGPVQGIGSYIVLDSRRNALKSIWALGASPDGPEFAARVNLHGKN